MKAMKKLKNMKNFGIKSDLIRSITKNSDNHEKKYMKIKLN